jgi:hypothetical protein
VPRGRVRHRHISKLPGPHARQDVPHKLCGGGEELLAGDAGGRVGREEAR